MSPTARVPKAPASATNPASASHRPGRDRSSTATAAAPIAYSPSHELGMARPNSSPISGGRISPSAKARSPEARLPSRYASDAHRDRQHRSDQSPTESQHRQQIHETDQQRTRDGARKPPSVRVAARVHRHDHAGLRESQNALAVGARIVRCESSTQATGANGSAASAKIELLVGSTT
jgi:hypothetical protein